jgi:hypothetical protein
MTRIILFLLPLCTASGLFSQEFGYGFKAGLNFNSFVADSEMDDTGKELEEFTRNTGFHVGAIFSWKATELMGMRGELLFSQKGGRRKFEGPSYYFFTTATGNRIVSAGNRKMTLNVTNSYLDIPVSGYWRPFSWLELHAGAHIGFLVGSTAFGELTYSGKTQNGASVAEFEHELDYNYYSDGVGEADFDSEPPTVQINGEKIPLPQSAGAYYEFTEDPGSFYKAINVGALGGLSLFFNKSLFLSFRANYGMSDLTKPKADVSLVKLDASNQLIPRDDKDKHLSLQASIGFAF